MSFVCGQKHSHFSFRYNLVECVLYIYIRRVRHCLKSIDNVIFLVQISATYEYVALVVCIAAYDVFFIGLLFMVTYKFLIYNCDFHKHLNYVALISIKVLILSSLSLEIQFFCS
jgi:hypothetical protein